MVEATIRMVDENVSFNALRATRGKVVRAEPVAALNEKRLVHHVGSRVSVPGRGGIFGWTRGVGCGAV